MWQVLQQRRHCVHDGRSLRCAAASGHRGWWRRRPRGWPMSLGHPHQRRCVHPRYAHGGLGRRPAGATLLRPPVVVPRRQHVGLDGHGMQLAGAMLPCSRLRVPRGQHVELDGHGMQLAGAMPPLHDGWWPCESFVQSPQGRAPPPPSSSLWLPRPQLRPLKPTLAQTASSGASRDGGEGCGHFPTLLHELLCVVQLARPHHLVRRAVHHSPLPPPRFAAETAATMTRHVQRQTPPVLEVHSHH